MKLRNSEPAFKEIMLKIIFFSLKSHFLTKNSFHYYLSENSFHYYLNVDNIKTLYSKNLASSCIYTVAGLNCVLSALSLPDVLSSWLFRRHPLPYTPFFESYPLPS